MKVGYLQFKPEFGRPEQNIKRIEDLISDKDFDLLVLPELANSGYLFCDKNELLKCGEEIPNGDFCRSLLKICKGKDAFIVSGICEKSGNRFYNSSVLVHPDGTINTYRKIHLFYDEKLWFASGNNKLEVFEIKTPSFTIKVGMMICFDWMFPETARTLALKGAQIICHPSNLVMPYCQTAMFTRALENQVFTITANRIGKDENGNKDISFTGQSVILDPKGNYLSRASEDREECVIVEIDERQALNKNLNPHNNLFEDRRTDIYDL